MDNNNYNAMNYGTVNNVPNNNTEPKSRTGLYIVIMLLAFAVVGLSTALVFSLVSNKCEPCTEKAGNADDSNKTQDKTEGGDEDKTDSDADLVAKRDTQREDDISRFMTAVNDFQMNNNGKTPWSSGKTNEKFVTRYIDAKCNYSNGAYVCSDDAKEFRDPDGAVYNFDYLGSLGSTFTGDINKVIGAWPNKHTVVVVTKAACDDAEVIKKGTGERELALLYRLESGEITCNDNH